MILTPAWLKTGGFDSSTLPNSSFKTSFFYYLYKFATPKKVISSVKVTGNPAIL